MALSPEEQAKWQDRWKTGDLSPKQRRALRLLADRGEFEIPEQGTNVGEAIVQFAKSPEGKRAALELAGGAAGTMAFGGGVPVTAGKLARIGSTIGRSLGAGVGAATGSVVASKTVDPVDNVNDEAKQAALWAVGGEAAVSAVAGLFRSVKGGLVQSRNKGIGSISERIERHGGTVTPGLGMEHAVVDVPEVMAEFGIGSSGQIERTRQKAIQIAEDLANNYSRHFITKLERVDSGQVVLDAIAGNSNAWKQTGKELFGMVDQLTKPRYRMGPDGPVLISGGVDMTRIRRLVRQIAKESDLGFGSAKTEEMLRTILEKGELITFKQAQVLRSELLTQTRTPKLATGGEKGELVSDKSTAFAKRLVKAFDNAMEESAEQMPAPARTAFRAANAFWKEGQQTFNNRLIRNLADADPEKVANVVFRRQSETLVKRVKAALGGEGTRAWRETQGMFLTKLFREATKDDTLNGETLLRLMKKNYGMEVMQEAFTPTQLRSLIKHAETLATVQAQPGKSKVGSMFIQLFQSRAAFQLAQGALVGISFGAAGGATPESITESGLIIMTPIVFAKVLTNPKFSRLMLRGMQLPKTNPASQRIFGQLQAMVGKEMSSEEGSF